MFHVKVNSPAIVSTIRVIRGVTFENCAMQFICVDLRNF